MLKDITLGQYIPGNSVVHRLDPRTKILLMIAYIVAVFIVKRIEMFIPVILFTVLITVLAKVPANYMLKAAAAADVCYEPVSYQNREDDC